MYSKVTTTSWSIFNNNCRFLYQTSQIQSWIRIRIWQKVTGPNASIFSSLNLNYFPTNGSRVGQRCNAQGELSLVLVNLFRDSKQIILKRTADWYFTTETEMRKSAKFYLAIKQ
jgi:hypothetical protein